MNVEKGFQEFGLFKLLILTLCLISLFTLGCEKKDIREPVVAGKFYPEDEKKLYDLIDELFKNSPQIYHEKIFALIVPHAGYQYSGAIAGLAFAQVLNEFDTAIILAGNHNGQARYQGISLDRRTHFRIPGALIPLDTKRIKFMLLDPFYKEIRPANEMHMIEVILPFLKKLSDLNKKEFKIIPEIIGEVDDEGIKKIAGDIIGLFNENSILIGSMDLSHYYPYEKAIELDRTCISAVLQMDEEKVKRCETDANSVLLTFITFAKKLNLMPRLVAYRNSGDVYGEKDSVVGYASIVFVKKLVITDEEKKVMTTLARKSIEHYLTTGEKYTPFLEEMVLKKNDSNLLARRGTFVTITKKGELRGCIGSLVPKQSIYLDIVENAVKAATEDPRFPPLKKEELKDIKIEVSVLDFPQQLIVKNNSEAPRLLTPGEDGVILYYKMNQSTFLPDVWRSIRSPTRFLTELCKKQGSPPDCWKQPEAHFYTYRTISVSE